MDCEEAVAAAAREEQEARAELKRGVTPSHPNWAPEHQESFSKRLERWQAASHALVEALNRFGSERTGVH